MDQFRTSTGSGKLPAGLAGVLNKPEEHRDSAYFSSADGLSTKHNSTTSSAGIALTPSSGYTSPTADTPSPVTAPFMSHSINSPSAGMSVASMVSPTSSAHPDQAMLNRLNSNRQQSYDNGPTSAPIAANSDALARRESVDSRLGQNFGSLQLTSSPYASKNQSTTSIQGALQQQRNPGADRNSGSRWSNSSSYLPHVLSPKTSAFRVAPTITGPTLGNIARAAEPTKGQAWAFPEEERLPEEPQSRVGTSFLLDSRRSSFADSIASSHLTTESRYPAGQRRLDEGLAHEMRRSSRASSEYASTHHHHSLQNRQLGDLQTDEGDSPNNGQPYSRTPELRVSHKLAERKRRTEMKELFESLRDLMPQERGSKASKWEILTKAIAEHQRLTDIIDKLDRALHVSQKDNENTRRENTALRNENSQLRSQVQEFGNGNAQYQTNGHMNHNPTHMDAYGHETYRNGRPDQFHNRSELPPLRMPAHAPVDSMNGIQFTHGFGDRRF